MRKREWMAILGLAGLAVAIGLGVWKYWVEKPYLFQSFVNPKSAYCPLSGRPIHTNMLTVIKINGRTLRVCCARCALTYEQQTGRRVEILRVTDYLTGKPIHAAKAYFVSGSNVAPCCAPPIRREGGRTPYIRMFDRCSPSLLAFANQNDARTFAAQHGGAVTRLSNLEEHLKSPTSATGEARHD